jgi:hypothetical protein
VSQGWPATLSSLKSLLETGDALEATKHWPTGCNSDLSQNRTHQKEVPSRSGKLPTRKATSSSSMLGSACASEASGGFAVASSFFVTAHVLPFDRLSWNAVCTPVTAVGAVPQASTVTREPPPMPDSYE